MDSVTLGGTNTVKSGGTLSIASGATFTYTAGASLGGDLTELRADLGLAIGTNVQAFDADLTTYAGITPAANVQTFLGAADYAAMRTQLGLVIGTNVQAFDADLTTYAGITPSANVQSFLVAADYAAMRTQLTLVPGTDILAVPASSAEGDILYRDGSGWTRLAKGTDGQVLKSTTTTVAWGTDSTGAGSLPATPAEGDIAYYDGANWVSLAIGTAGQLLATNGTADAPEWIAAPSSSAATFSVRRAANQSLTSSSEASVTFDTENWDTSSFWASSPNPERITFASAAAGKYQINIEALFDANASGIRYINIRKNGVDAAHTGVQIASAGSASTRISYATTIDCDDGDYIEFRIDQNSGSSLNLVDATISGFKVAD